MKIEIELRYEVLKPEQLSSALQAFKQLNCTHQTDTYFDNNNAELYQKGIFIRVRDGKKLDFKFNRACLDNPNLAYQDYCEEYSFPLPLRESDMPKINELLIGLRLNPSAIASLENLKQANNFIDHYTIDKTRTSYTADRFTIAVDEVAELGTFLEIELMVDNADDLDIVKKEMQHLLVDLELKSLKTGYGTLLLRKKDFKHYLQGRFILEEDRRYRDQQAVSIEEHKNNKSSEQINVEMNVQPGMYRHYKGSLYEVIGVARHSETEEPLVLYKALYKTKFGPKSLWVRPITMFFDTVEVQGKKQPRFEKLEKHEEEAF